MNRGGGYGLEIPCVYRWPTTVHQQNERNYIINNVFNSFIFGRSVISPLAVVKNSEVPLSGGY